MLRDVKKAFDKVWRRGLQYKILQLGLNPILERILCDYVMERRAFLSIKDYSGPEFELGAGVPQGGCMSALLYNIYTIDLP